MNYSHYLAFFSSKKDPDAFARFMQDVRQIVESQPEGSNLCGQKRKEPPVINDRSLIIGSSENKGAFSRLEILLDGPAPKHRYNLATINTQRLPYDTVICAVLLAFVHHFPAAEVTSDGTSKDWAPAIALYQYATERKAPGIHLREG